MKSSFKKISDWEVYSSEGFGFKRELKHEIKYWEGENNLYIECEIIVDPEMGIVLYIGGIKFWQAPKKEIISNEKKLQIVENISTCLDFLDIFYELDDEPYNYERYQD